MERAMTTFLILGGNGVFGVHLTQYLLRHEPDAHVISVGRNPEKPGPFSLHRGIDDARYEYHQIHIVFEDDRLMELIQARRPQCIVNFAALAADVASSWKYSARYYETNTVSLARITDRLVGAPWLERWVQIGSSEIYGSVTAPADEQARITPTSPYAVSKAAGDMHLAAIHNVRGFPMNILWPSNAYGSGQQLYRIVPRTILACLLDRTVPLQGGGKAVKSYIHAQDLARAIHLVFRSAAPGACYNLGPERGIAIHDLVAMIVERLGRRFDDVVRMAPDRLGQDAQFVLDSAKIRRELGWTPEISLETGLDETITWARRYLDELKALSTDVVFQA
jgi:dTDP-glucose 4,6-dehydratase